MEHQARIFDRLTTWLGPVNFPRDLPPRKMQFLFRSVSAATGAALLREESRTENREEEEKEKEKERERKGGREFLWRGILRAAGLENGGEGVGGAVVLGVVPFVERQ